MAEFRLAETFTQSLARLDGQSQKAAKIAALDLQLNPAAPGLRFHRITDSRDPNFWSIRAGSDIRIIVHKTETSFLLAYVGHHDAAYAWAERRRLETHPRTGAIQLVEVRERVEDIATPAAAEPGIPPEAPPAPPVFADLSADDLLGIGVPPDWLADVQAATEDSFLQVAEHLPAEAAEALLDYAVSGRLRPAPAMPVPSGAAPDPFAHPDAQRRFRVVENQEELARALDAPWERWIVFLHPTQQGVVDRAFNGPARVAGSAGTGKTVVALHRAVRLARASAERRVLLTTFSQPLASALERRVAALAAGAPGVVSRITVAPFRTVADELFQLAFGSRPFPASDEQIRHAVTKAAESVGGTGYPLRFLLPEWRHVVDAWQIDSVDAYASVPRLGRKSRMSAGQRERLWPVFAATRASLAKRGLLTWSEIFGRATDHFAAQTHKPFCHVVVDEAQDLGVPELRFLAAIAPAGPDALFFAGDLGQRIFQQPFSWKELGVEVRGRSSTLTVNYRTSHQIRRLADRLLPSSVRDVDDPADGRGDERDRTVSIFSGPEPELHRFASPQEEIEAVAAWLRVAMQEGVAPAEISVFVRSRDQMDRARAVVAGLGVLSLELSDRDEAPGARLPIGTMHLAKGLEFKAVAVMACDDDALPLRSRIESVADEVELDHVYETERHLFYVACTRARDRLLVSGVKPGSEFLDDLASRSR